MIWIKLIPNTTMPGGFVSVFLVYLLAGFSVGGNLFRRYDINTASLPACLLVKLKSQFTCEVSCAKSCARDSRCRYFLYNSHEDGLCVLCIETRDYSFLDKTNYLSHSMVSSVNLNLAYIRVVDSCQPKEFCIPRNCGEYREQGYHKSGEYLVLSPTGTHGQTMSVYCDMDTDDGGWMVFQRRIDGSLDFYLNWSQYKEGFGNISHEFWMGNDQLAAFTQQGDYEMRVDLADFEGSHVYATFSNFTLDPNDYYRLDFSAYSGNTGDSLADQKGMQFSTFDNDRDQHSDNCAILFKGAWWYVSCHRSNLNGQYLGGPTTTFADGITWKSFRGQHYSLKSTEMKIRPHNFIPPKALYQLETDLPPPQDCSDLRDRGHTQNGVYTVYIQHLGTSLDVYCDMSTDGGGWLVFQRRSNGSVDFYRGWNDYVDGFGQLEHEFWLGNIQIASITEQGSYELRVDMSDFDDVYKYANYGAFALDRNSNYQLRIDYYSGDAGDSLTYSNGQKWSTFDRDNDENASESCASKFKGAWWYKACHYSNLNGLYLGGAHEEFAIGVNWRLWRGNYYSLKWTEMKLRPAGYTPPN